MVQLTLLLAMVVNCKTILQQTCKNTFISFWCQAHLKGHLKALEIEENIKSTHTYSILSMYNHLRNLVLYLHKFNSFNLSFP